MSAFVIVATQKQWDFLKELPEGAIIVSPRAARQYGAKHGGELPDWIDYDFGGDPDLWIDLVDDFDDPENTYAAECILNPDGDEETEEDGD